MKLHADNSSIIRDIISGITNSVGGCYLGLIAEVNTKKVLVKIGHEENMK